MNIEELKKQLEKHEAKRLKPYLDCCGKYWRECTCEKKGKLTIGIGRNLDDVGISDDEAYYLCGHDILGKLDDLDRVFPWWRGLSENRQLVLANMAFNIGITRLMGFKNMLQAVQDGLWSDAAKEMLNSRWASQVGRRATELADMMEVG